MPSREFDKAFAGFRLDVGGVDDDQATAREAHPRDVVEDVERIACGRLVVLVVGDNAAACVRRNDLSREKMLAGKRRLAGPGYSDEDDERDLRDRQVDSVKTPICVGAPTTGSFGPTGIVRTE